VSRKPSSVLLGVVPAKAGTHTPWRALLKKVSNAGILTDRLRRMGPGSSPGRRRCLLLHPHPNTSLRSRGALRPSFCQKFLTHLKTEGAGKTGCALHPRSRVQVAQKNAHTSIQVQRRASGLPCAMALRLIRDLPGEPCAFATVDARLGASGPHDFAVRFMRVRPAHSASTASHPCVRGDRERPSCRVRRVNHTPSVDFG